MEKMKDFLYEISDIIFGIIVLGIVIFIFAFQLQDFFSYDITRPFSVVSKDAPVVSKENDSNAENSTSSPVKENSSSSSSGEKLNQEEGSSSSSDNKVTEGVLEEPDPQTTTPTENTQTESSNEDLSKTIQITINPGSSSDTIANILYEQNVIQSKNDFTTAIKDRNLETKLKAGTFSIPKGSSLDEVINIIIK